MNSRSTNTTRLRVPRLGTPSRGAEAERLAQISAESRFKSVLAILSLLHEPIDRNSLTRHLSGEPVLSSTLRRLTQCRHIAEIAILCWDDQSDLAATIATQHGAEVVSKGPRRHLAQLEALSAARRWSEGWRGGLLQSCTIDAGFYAPFVSEAVEQFEADAAVMVLPSSALVDAEMIDQLIELAEEKTHAEFTFVPAAPGVAGMLITRELLKTMATALSHPGKLLAYRPDQPRRDPLTYDVCLPAPPAVVRTSERITVDSDRQRRRIELSVLSPNDIRAEHAIAALEGIAQVDPMPRDVTLELNARRNTQPIWLPTQRLSIERPPIAVDLARELFAELGHVDDLRLTLAGLGDPLLHPQLESLLDEADRAGIRSIHIETDLLPDDDRAIEVLAKSNVDIISVNIPAMCAPVYASMMGADRLREVLENLKKLLISRAKRGRGTPVIVPTFVKCEANLSDMEAWYDHWLRALGAAAIVGPSDFGGAMQYVGVADMCPSTRRPCRRLNARLTVLCDGAIVSCENDVRGLQSIGRVGSTSINEAFSRRLNRLRDDHAAGRFNAHDVCTNCRDWDRP